MSTTSNPGFNSDAAALPINVIEAIHANQNIEAIKRLRKHRNLSLKESKSIVDTYAREHPHLITRRSASSEQSGRRDRSVNPIKQLVGLLLLCLLGFSLFIMVFAPLEIYKTISAQNWEPVEVTIKTNSIKEVSNHHHLDLSIEEVKSKKRSSKVAVRHGDMTLSFVAFGGLFNSTLYSDLKKYPVGAVVTAYRSPDRDSYVLEQNSIEFMLTLFAIACIYPAIAAWKVKRSYSRK